jgi:hypothetical protein
VRKIARRLQELEGLLRIAEATTDPAAFGNTAPARNFLIWRTINMFIEDNACKLK